MNRNSMLSVFLRTLAVGIALLFLAQISAAQLQPASPPLADPNDQRFKDVTEDWSTPTLDKSSLLPVQPLIGANNVLPTYTSEQLRMQWRFGDPIDLFVYKPKGVKKPPVILYLYSYPTDTDQFNDENFATWATKDGFAAVGFVSALTGHRYHDRPMKEWFLSDLQECLGTTAHDVQMVLNYLEARGDLDMNRVGMYTTGSGSSIGILTSAVDPRIKVLDTLSPWGDWPTWMATSPFVPPKERPAYVKPEFLKKAATLEPVDWLPKIQAKKFRLREAPFDPITPDPAKQKLRAAVPAGSTVVVYKTLDEFQAVVRSKKQLEWIEHELGSLPAAEESTTASVGK
jgi:hypothetical protein